MDGDLSALTKSAATGHVVVLGGGITGLAAAHRLLQHGAEATSNLRVTLVEAEDRLGGKIVTEHIDDFVIEGGPDSFLATKPRGIGLCAELELGEHSHLQLQGVRPQRRRAFVLWRGRLHDLPEGLSGLVPTRLAPLARSSLLSPIGKARVALDYLLPARRAADDESLGGFIRRRLGREAWERLVEPLMAGIYAADGDQLSLSATFPQLREAERRYGGLIKGVLASRRLESSPVSAPRSPFLTPVGGLGAVVSALETRLRDGDVRLVLGDPVTAVTSSGSGFEVRLGTGGAIQADAVIVATPAYSAADLLAELDPVLATELAAIPHASTAIVTLAYRREEIRHPLDGHGYVIPRAERSPILACTWSSRKWSGRAPDGWELIRVFIGRAGQEEVLAANDESLVALAVQEVSTRLGVTAPASLTRVRHWPRGMPQYLLGHPQRVARIEARKSKKAGLYLAGNAFHGVGLPDCILSGERAADAVAAYLRVSSRSLGPPSAVH
ncbi:MAG TPA: protoporphyrinogen oxidase [Thermomicrobiales bacterium]|nr:protoporphyrinogen oxidase [Thermomicrobiales bacterium]